MSIWRKFVDEFKTCYGWSEGHVNSLTWCRNFIWCIIKLCLAYRIRHFSNSIFNFSAQIITDLRSLQDPNILLIYRHQGWQHVENRNCFNRHAQELNDTKVFLHISLLSQQQTIIMNVKLSSRILLNKRSKQLHFTLITSFAARLRFWS